MLHKPCSVADGLSPGKNRVGKCPDRRGWEQDCGDLGHKIENWTEKPLLQEGDDQHPDTNIFEGVSLPRDRERMGEQRMKILIKKLRLTHLHF